MWRFDAENAFLQLARSGLPRMQEMQIDAKKDLDNVLKSACFSLKHSAVKVLLGNIDAFLAKVTAFVGDIPISIEGSAADPAAAAAAKGKKKWQFQCNQCDAIEAIAFTILK